MAYPRVSVIIPIYNIEGYIARAIESVLNQSIGFENVIELILVNDGSTDKSGDIAKGYADEYPESIVYKSVKNGGVSKARNTGMQLAHGQYIHFFDGDDILSENFYEESIKFLETHDEVDFVASKLMFFDAAIDSHPLNYKFKKSRVIDVKIEPDSPILHVISCVFRRSRLEDISFDEKLSVSEDMKFLSDVLLKKKKYGVVTKSTYNYRKRDTTSSAIGSKEGNKSYYTATPLRAYKHLLDTWGSDSQIVDYTLLYDISYRLDQKTESVLSSAERQAYKDMIRDILKHMSDEVVARHRFLSIDKKMYIFGLKYGDKLRDHTHQRDGVVYVDGHSVYDTRSVNIHIDFMENTSNGYKIEGYVDGYIINRNDYRLRVNGKAYDITYTPRVQREAAFLGDVYSDGNAFEVTVDTGPGETIQFEDAKGNGLILKTGQFTRLASYGHTYRRDDARIVSKSPRKIKIHRYSRLLHISFELRQLLLILTHWKLDVFIDRFKNMVTRNFTQLSRKARVIEMVKPALFVAETVCMIPRALVLRIAYYTGKNTTRRPIWIISDRGMSAGDNGEALFRYVMEQKDRPADVYFALSKKSKDYDRLRSVGPVLNYGGLRYKYKFLLADKIISSHADIEVTNPFLRQIDHFVDLYNFDFIFLQHGIIRNDLSNWLNRFDKNISLFVTSAQKEYDSILDYPYYYTKENVLLSGLPRYDELENNPKNKVIIAPTYRNSLLRLKTNQYGERAYDDQFKNSEYRRFYNNLINDPDILKAMKKAGLTGEFYVHPNFAAQTSDFEGNDVFTVKKYPYDYTKAINEGTLLISDYSSIVLDFAYLQKPIIYVQFDAEEFYQSQPYGKGDFFDDNTDGFGPVCVNHKSTVGMFIHMVESGLLIEDEYKKRIDKFFKFRDKNNSRRVYDAIVNKQ